MSGQFPLRRKVASLIPKKIHYVWFSDEMPLKIQNYIEGWKKHCSDYEIIRWNANNFDVSRHKWVEQAVSHKKWAFATDYIRFWAVYNYGGIYLDSDVEILRPFGEELAEFPYFLGMEKTKGIIEGAIFGAEAKTEWVKDCLDYYENRDFVLGENKFDLLPLPYIMLKIFKSKYGLSLIENPKDFDKNSGKIQILPPKYFSPKRWNEPYAKVYECTMAIHHFNGTWSNVGNNSARVIKNKIADFVGEDFYTKKMFRAFAGRSS